MSNPTYKTVVQTAPARIYLNVSDEAEHHDQPFPTQSHGDEVCWSESPALACAVEYLRADLAQHAVPEGFALVPLRMNKAMQYVTEQEDWTWEDLLAAAGAVTEDQYNEIAAAPQAEQQAVPEIDYVKLVEDCYRITKQARGTRGCVAFKQGAEWFREQLIAAADQYLGEQA